MPVERLTGLIGSLLDLDVEPAVGHRVGGTGDTPVQALKRDRGRAAREANLLAHLGDGADVGEILLVPRHKQHLLSSPVSTASVSDIPGKTTTSSSGTRRRRVVDISAFPILSIVSYDV